MVVVRHLKRNGCTNMLGLVRSHLSSLYEASITFTSFHLHRGRHHGLGVEQYSRSEEKVFIVQNTLLIAVIKAPREGSTSKQLRI